MAYSYLFQMPYRSLHRSIKCLPLHPTARSNGSGRRVVRVVWVVWVVRVVRVVRMYLPCCVMLDFVVGSLFARLISPAL